MFGFDDDSIASYYAEQGFDNMLQGEEEDYGGCTPPPVICKYCGAVDLHWRQTSKGWRLYSGLDEIHICTQYKPKISDI